MYIKLRLLPLLAVAWILFGSFNPLIMILYRNYLIDVFSFEWSLDANYFDLLAIFYFIWFVTFLSEEWEVFLIFALYFHMKDVMILKNLITKHEHLDVFESSNLLAFEAEELSALPSKNKVAD